MNNLNSILIEGNMVRDPVYHTTPKGTPVCNFSLASNRFFRQDSGLEKEVSFFEIETWAKLAEACNNQGKKGRGVRVVGRLKQDRWTGTDGKPKSRISIVAEHVEFRPELKKDMAWEKNDLVNSNIAAEAAAAMQDYNPEPDYAGVEGNPVMTDVLEPVTF